MDKTETREQIAEMFAEMFDPEQLRKEADYALTFVDPDDYGGANILARIICNAVTRRIMEMRSFRPLGATDRGEAERVFQEIKEAERIPDSE